MKKEERVIKLKEDLKKIEKIMSIYEETDFTGGFASDFIKTIYEHTEYLKQLIEKYENVEIK